MNTVGDGSLGSNQTTPTHNNFFGGGISQRPLQPSLFPSIAPVVGQEQTVPWHLDLSNIGSFPMAMERYSSGFPFLTTPSILPGLPGPPPPQGITQKPLEVTGSPGFQQKVQEAYASLPYPLQTSSARQTFWSILPSTIDIQSAALFAALQFLNPVGMTQTDYSAPEEEEMATFHAAPSTPEANAPQLPMDLLFGLKKNRLCRKCKCHGIQTPVKFHKGRCPFDPCTCERGCKRLQKERITRNAANKARRGSIPGP